MLPIVAARVQNLTQALNHDLTDDQVDIMSVMSNQYFDVAGMVLPQQLPTLLELIDSNKLLYASDTPYTPTPAVLSLQNSWKPLAYFRCAEAGSCEEWAEL